MEALLVPADLAEHVEMGVSPGAGTGTRPPEMGEGGVGGVAVLAPAPEVGDAQPVWVAGEGEAAGRVLPASAASRTQSWRLVEPRGTGCGRPGGSPGRRWGVSWHILKVLGKEKELSL